MGRQFSTLEKRRAASRKWQTANPTKKRESYWRHKGWPMPTRPKPEACEACGKVAQMCLDHCHQTNKFRGWLCHNCNLGIGSLGDNSIKIKLALSYLERFECQI